MEELTKVIKDIIFLPQTFHKSGIISTYSILRSSGYFDRYQEIREQDILEELRKYSECIKDWLQYSEDKRTSTGWYFIKEGPDKFIVGYLGEQGHTEEMFFTNELKACSSFIKLEMEMIRQI